MYRSTVHSPGRTGTREEESRLLLAAAWCGGESHPRGHVACVRGVVLQKPEADKTKSRPVTSSATLHHNFVPKHEYVVSPYPVTIHVLQKHHFVELQRSIKYPLFFVSLI